MAFSFTGSINYMSLFTMRTNSVVQVSSSTFPGALVQMQDVFQGNFYYDDNPPLGPLQQDPGTPDGFFLRYNAPAETSGTVIRSTRNGVGAQSKSGAEFFVDDQWFGDSTSMYNYDYDTRFVKHIGITWAFPAGTLHDGHVPGSSELLTLRYAYFWINFVDLVSGDQLQVNGSIDSMTASTPTQIPEPLTPVLFGLAAVMALTARRMGKGIDKLESKPSI
ncbi:PEP-CTERM protein-sorting domain-containing protein [Massilia sp. CF038]|nr:PEP-CTERM protein-sorting domain-containing protein [Massilia sp. CF038]